MLGEKRWMRHGSSQRKFLGQYRLGRIDSMNLMRYMLVSDIGMGKSIESYFDATSFCDAGLQEKGV